MVHLLTSPLSHCTIWNMLKQGLEHALLPSLLLTAVWIDAASTLSRSRRLTVDRRPRGFAHVQLEAAHLDRQDGHHPGPGGPRR